MSRRAGQSGHVEVSGHWWVVRYWMDVPGQYRRKHMSTKICPTNGLGKMTKPERERRAKEIVAQSGANTAECLAVAEASFGVTFRQQAEQWLKDCATRKRDPIKPATLSAWENCIKVWLNPNLGDALLSAVNNAAMKTLVAKMATVELSPKTILNYTQVAKMVVASAVSEDGEALYPRKWNSQFIDLPKIDGQRQPTFTSETMSAIVKNTEGQHCVLYALLAGTGLRIGEALGLEVGKHISGDCRTLYIRQSVWECDIQDPKTKNAVRDVDLCSALATLLKTFIGERKAGFLFANLKGKALSQTNLLRRSLHPTLKALGVEQTGFHAMRRARTTWLRKNRAPEDLIRFWLGHANKSVTDGYSKLDEDVEYRKEVAEKVGLGFVIPTGKVVVVPNVRKKSVKVEVAVAA
jgi:integrase